MRIRKVSYVMAPASRRHRTAAGRSSPLIRLSGSWLAAHGFAVGSGYTLAVENGTIILKPAA